jgi:hypothetical protein
MNVEYLRTHLRNNHTGYETGLDVAPGGIEPLGIVPGRHVPLLQPHLLHTPHATTFFRGKTYDSYFTLWLQQSQSSLEKNTTKLLCTVTEG